MINSLLANNEFSVRLSYFKQSLLANNKVLMYEHYHVIITKSRWVTVDCLSSIFLYTKKVCPSISGKML